MQKGRFARTRGSYNRGKAAFWKIGVDAVEGENPGVLSARHLVYARELTDGNGGVDGAWPTGPRRVSLSGSWLVRLGKTLWDAAGSADLRALPADLGLPRVSPPASGCPILHLGPCASRAAENVGPCLFVAVRLILILESHASIFSAWISVSYPANWPNRGRVAGVRLGGWCERKQGADGAPRAVRHSQSEGMRLK